MSQWTFGYTKSFYFSRRHTVKQHYVLESGLQCACHKYDFYH